jgi:hypothetical protein
VSKDQHYQVLDSEPPLTSRWCPGRNGAVCRTCGFGMEAGAGAGQDRGDLPRLGRPGEEETLAEVAAEVSQGRSLLVGLDPVGDRPQF